MIGHDFLNLPESIFTYVYKGLKKLDRDISFVSAGLFTLQYTTSALGSLRAEVAERGTQITQPPCTSSYVRWRFCTTQCVKKLSCTYLTAHSSVPPPPCTSPTFAAFWQNLHLKLSCAYLTRTGPGLGSPVPIFSAPLSGVCTCVKNSAMRSLLRARFVPACLLQLEDCSNGAQRSDYTSSLHYLQTPYVAKQ